MAVSKVLPDTVKYDDGIVHRVTDDRKDRRNERLVHIKVERKESVQQCENRNYEEGIVCQSYDRTDRVLPVTESDQDVGKDRDEC